MKLNRNLLRLRAFWNFSLRIGEKELINTTSRKINVNKKFVLISGETGTGKSTLLETLCGLYQNFNGNISICGIDLKKDDLSDYYDEISYVPQRLYSIAGSITENITLHAELNNDLFEKVLKSSVLDDLKINYDLDNTFISDDTTMLSGGQLQRFAVARAIYRKPKILFLDESTSGLDVKTEKTSKSRNWYHNFYDLS